VWSWLCGIAALGVTLSGLRDFAASRRTTRIAPGDAAPLAAALGGRRSILLTGGTGFIGGRLVAALVGAGHDVTVLTRSRAGAAHLPAPIRLITSLDQLSDDAVIDAVINLAGEPIASGLWTARRRRAILRPRLRTTRDVVRLIGRLRNRPAVLISGSAVGWYGVRGDEVLDETAAGEPCFSRDVCVRWEREAKAAAALGVRVVCLRIGLVLGSEGGVLSRLLTPFEFGLGGPFGGGRHWMSWIHRDDLVRLIVHALASPALAGPVNATAPEPVTNSAFASALGAALGRPAKLRVPAAPLRWLLGDFAEELLLGGQRVVPRAAVAAKFRFMFPDIDAALADITGQAGKRAAPGRVHAERSLLKPRRGGRWKES